MLEARRRRKRQHLYRCRNRLLDFDFQRICLFLQVELSNPFKGNHDVFNVDALMASSEQAIFATLRANFDLVTVQCTKSRVEQERRAVDGNKLD